jgi:hemolysin D
MEEKENKENNKAAENESGGYPVRVKMLAETLKTKNGDTYKVKPGMSVTAEVNVGKRRVIEFFLFPIIRYLDEGLKVR